MREMHSEASLRGVFNAWLDFMAALPRRPARAKREFYVGGPVPGDPLTCSRRAIRRLFTLQRLIAA